MSDRLHELRRQRALVQEHLAWLDREIAAAPQPHPEQATRVEGPVTQPYVPSPAPAALTVVQREAAAILAQAAMSPVPAVAQVASLASADEMLDEYRVAPHALKTDVKKGCFLYFFAALAAVATGVIALYFLFNRGR